MTRSALAYVPVVHRGYLDFFRKANCEANYVLDQALVEEFPALRKELRALKPHEALEGVRGALDWNRYLRLASKIELRTIAESGGRLVMPDEDIMHELYERYLAGLEVEFVPVFLRWDRQQTKKQDVVAADRQLSEGEFDLEIMSLAYAKALESTNIWRRVGAALVKNGEVVLTASNVHQPSPQSPWIEGDPRNNLSRGVGMEVSTDLHAEASIVGRAARSGIELAGCSLYVTTFPCPWCAKLLAVTGLERCYFHVGYSVLDGERILKSAGIELIQVVGDFPPPPPETLVPYPPK